MSEGRGNHKVILGKVISDKMDKTIVVEVTRRYLHPVYKKYITRSRRFKAHDETNQCGVGDLVELVETRPLSHDKRWRLRRVMQKAL
ncbi:MAG: 30S ribosomal protein S17 [Deltaproteobacteria bacterium]|nr:30S ribosomal protein S17 [Deltaproteobacteria bacterium]